MSQNSLYSRIVKDASKIDEIEVFLSTYFGSSGQTEPGKIVHGNQIEVQYKSNRREISDILVVGDISDELLDKLEQDIDDQVFADHGNDVRVVHIFTCPSMVGQVRVGNDFQIIPVPAEAPKPAEIMANHPALLEFVYQKSPNMLIDQHRRAKRQRELVGLLNVLIRGGVSDNSCTGQKAWILDSSVTPWTSDWRQIDYASSAKWGEKDEFGFSINEIWENIPRKEPADYYSRSGYAVNYPFHFPASFESSVDRYFTLGFDEQEQFQIAAHWVAKSSEVKHASESLSYTALLFALEGLMKRPEKIGHCDPCHRDKYDKSIKDCFEELLEEHGARCPRADITKIYGIRSSIAHGGGLLPRDREVMGFRFNVEQNEKDAVFRRLRLVCMVVLINWLHSDARTEKD